MVYFLIRGWNAKYWIVSPDQLGLGLRRLGGCMQLSLNQYNQYITPSSNQLFVDH